MISLHQKKEIHQRCLQIIREKTDAVKTQIAELNRSFSEDSKSSAGDKHETARAMAQLESEKLHQHLHQLELQRTVLQKIDPSQPHEFIQNGSLMETDKGVFYIAVPLGKVENVMVISPASPLGKLFLENKKMELTTFNGTTYEIKNVI